MPFFKKMLLNTPKVRALFYTVAGFNFLARHSLFAARGTFKTSHLRLPPSRKHCDRVPGDSIALYILSAPFLCFMLILFIWVIKCSASISLWRPWHEKTILLVPLPKSPSFEFVALVPTGYVITFAPLQAPNLDKFYDVFTLLLDFYFSVSQVLGLSGMDFVIVDLEHGPGNVWTAVQELNALESMCSLRFARSSCSSGLTALSFTCCCVQCWDRFWRRSFYAMHVITTVRFLSLTTASISCQCGYIF